MNPFVIHYVSGAAFFVGLLLIAVGAGMSFCPWWFVKSSLARIICIMGGLNIFFSATPLPYFLLLLLYITLAVQVLVGGSEKLGLKPRLVIGGVLELILLIALFVELPHWWSPEPMQLKTNRIVVLGDSISAGIGFNGEKTWTDILIEKHKYHVANKSVGGGTVATAINSLKKVKVTKGDLIIIEIGGNDFFKGTYAKKFHQNLDELLTNAKKCTPQVIMLELPLPFLKVSFGRSQRELAAKHKVLLIPKRYFAHVFSGYDSADDGLHLSNYGHRKMADMIVKHITPAPQD
jgi:acyl-CoA thioesterase I